MTLQLFDGFEILPNLRNGGALSAGVANSNAGRTGGKALSFGTTSSTLTYPLPTPAAICYVGFAFKENGTAWAATTAGSYLCTFYGDAGAAQHVSINISNDGHITVRRGAANGTIIATSTLAITANAWHYMEVRLVISDAAGEVIVRVDGAELINQTGLDTKNSGTLTTVSTIGLGGFGGALYDDMYVCDGLGATYNSFLGDKVVKAGRPDGAGASTGFTPSAGSNYQCVDEDPWTALDYVSAAAAATDMYTHSDVAGFSSVDASQIVTYAFKTDAGARTLRTVTRSNIGTSVESPDLALPTSVAVVQGPIRQTDPDGLPLTQTLANSAQYGFKAV